MVAVFKKYFESLGASATKLESRVRVLMHKLARREELSEAEQRELLETDHRENKQSVITTIVTKVGIIQKHSELRALGATREQRHAEAVDAAKKHREFCDATEAAYAKAQLEANELYWDFQNKDHDRMLAERAYREQRVLEFQHADLLEIEHGPLDGYLLRSPSGDTIHHHDPAAPELHVDLPTWMNQQARRCEIMLLAFRQATEKHNAAIEAWSEKNKYVPYDRRSAFPQLVEPTWAGLTREQRSAFAEQVDNSKSSRASGL